MREAQKKSIQDVNKQIEEAGLVDTNFYEESNNKDNNGNSSDDEDYKGITDPQVKLE